MADWTDTINDWFTDTSNDWFTGDGAVIYVYSVSRYYLISESVDYFFTADPQCYHYVTQNSANYFEAKQ